MLTPKFSGQGEMGSASTLMKKEGTMTKKEEDVMTSQFSSQEMLGSTPLIGEVILTLELPSQEEQGTTVTPTYSSRYEYKIVSSLRKERKRKEVVLTFECSGQIELASASTLMSEEGIPIIKEQAMSTPKFSGQAELGFASTLTTKEGTMTVKEEHVMTSEFLG